ncbi:MAG: peptidylprolyl isomerase [Kofleriaceae bacterium]
MRKMISVRSVSVLLAVLALGACEHRKKAEPAPTPPAADEPPAAAPPAAPVAEVRAPVLEDLAEYTKDLAGEGKLLAEITTSMGVFHCELYEDKAPLTVANFVGLATGKKAWNATGKVEVGKPFYNGLTFHRVIPGFMIQGGDPMGNGSGGPGYQFQNETSPDAPHIAGAMSMANSGPNTNGSQFFITETAQPRLNRNYSVFGRCKETDLVKKIAGVPVSGEQPAQPITIDNIAFSRGAGI